MNKDNNKIKSRKSKQIKLRVIKGNSENNSTVVYPNNPLFIKAAVIGKKSPDIMPIEKGNYCKYCNNTRRVKLREGSIKCGCTYPEGFVFIIDIVCDFVDVEPHVLKYWESEFDIIKSWQNFLGDKFYRLKDVENFSLIKHMLYNDGLTISQTKSRLLFIAK